MNDTTDPVRIQLLRRALRSFRNRGRGLVRRGRSWRLAFWELAGAARIGHGVQLGANVSIDVYGSLLVGDGAFVDDGAALYVGPGATLELGRNVYVGKGTVVAASRSITIGDFTLIAEHCSVRDSDHVLDPLERRNHRTAQTTAVNVCRDVWIGAGVRVLRGVTIGQAAIVGANAVVRRSIPAGALAVGSPARVVRTYQWHGID